MRRMLMATAILCASCATTLHQVASPEKLLPGVVDGGTTREEVLLHFGIPSAQFEGERILTYELRQDAEGRLCVVSREVSRSDPRLHDWKRGTYSLVLVFAPDGVLARHSLLKAE